MPYHFVCPHCGSETLADDHYSGQGGPCFSCGEPVALPDFVADLPPDRQRQPPAGSKSRMGQVILVVGAGVVAFVISVVALMTFAFPGAQAIRSVRQRSACDRNLQRIGKALAAYHDEQGQFPPAHVTDANGQPMHSWRVLILPYLDEEGLYKRYDFNQPWNSPQNASLTMQMPEVFACPGDPEAKLVGETSYMVIVGRDTMFPGASSRGLSDLQDDPATTILVAETPVAGITWLEPKDLSAVRMQFAINTGFAREIGGYHRGGVNALMADGKVPFIPDTTPEEYVQAMTTIDRKENIPKGVLDN
ncbi:MAG: DUF1559 domain-containing protein [Pirellulaceae bacterium]